MNAAMRAAPGDDVGRARGAAIERQILAKNADRLDLRRRQVARDENRVPEAPQINAANRPRSNAQHIFIAEGRMTRAAILTHARLQSLRASSSITELEHRFQVWSCSLLSRRW